MNELTLFNNAEFGTIRSLTIEGEPWFVGKDVAEALGYSNASKAVSVHVDEEDRQIEIFRHSQNGNLETKTTIINESGVYSLIFSSKLESAKRFKHWVTSEVLPAIRKTGSYRVNRDYDKMEIARMIVACKSVGAVKAIMTLFDVPAPPSFHIPQNTNNSVTMFLSNVDLQILITVPQKEIYLMYKTFCKEKRLVPSTLANFSKEIHKQTDLIVRRYRIDGILTGFYTKG